MYRNALTENYGRQILTENIGGSFSKLNKFAAALESATYANQVDATMAKKLLDSIADKKFTNFGPIEDSQGDITRFKGFTNMVETLKLVKAMEPSNDTAVTARKQPSKTDDVLTAIRIIENNKNNFIRGYLINNDLIKMTYCTMVLACLDATSVLADDMVAYVRNISVPTSGLRNPQHRYDSMNQVGHIIKIDKNGDLPKLFNAVLDPKVKTQDNFIGTGAATAMLAVGAVIAIVPLVREVIYVFYQSRVSVDEYLKHQKLLLELNKGNIEQSNMKASDKKRVMAQQGEVLKAIDRASEKIRIKQETGAKKAENVIKQENKTWSLDNIEKEQSDFLMF